MVAYFLLVVEMCTCPSSRYLRNILADGNAYTHVENVRKSEPRIRWHIQCYHYETEHYTESQTDSNEWQHPRRAQDSHSPTRHVGGHRDLLAVLLGGYILPLPRHRNCELDAPHFRQELCLRGCNVCEPLPQPQAGFRPNESPGYPLRLQREL
jgi:hypothetical protein